MAGDLRVWWLNGVSDGVNKNKSCRHPMVFYQVERSEQFFYISSILHLGTNLLFQSSNDRCLPKIVIHLLIFLLIPTIESIAPRGANKPDLSPKTEFSDRDFYNYALCQVICCTFNPAILSIPIPLVQRQYKELIGATIVSTSTMMSSALPKALQYGIC